MGHLEANRIRRAALPAVASLAGAGLGLLLTRGSKLAEAMPGRAARGVGDLADDLMGKLGAARGKVPMSGERLSKDELDRRRRERAQRRKQRHARR